MTPTKKKSSTGPLGDSHQRGHKGGTALKHESHRRVVSPPTNPVAVAREFVSELYSRDGAVVLRDHRGNLYYWDGTCWPEIEKRDVRSAAYRFLEHVEYAHPDKGLVPFEPTRKKIDDLIDALRAVTLVRSAADVPTWIDNQVDPPASEMISLTNGLLHVPSRTLVPHTSSFFTHHSLPFAFSRDFTRPTRWQQFLHELWPNDESSILALQEVMGYILAGGTSLQKIFLFVGAKRAGKGTIGRVLTGLLGAHNVAAPTLASLSTNFGLSPLIGKPLALISDARLSNRADGSIVVERLLSISGEDSLTIDRKYKDPWTGRLPTRLVIMTNELPQITDSSGAVASRFVVFQLVRSFFGRENHHLSDELLVEASGIFNWALEGLDRLVARGHFVNPDSGSEAIQQLEDLSSPISAFMRDRCVIGPHQVETDTLWTAWKAWCDREGRHPGTRAIFGRDLKSAVPTLRRIRPRGDGIVRPYVYEGLGLARHANDREAVPGHPRPSVGPDGPGTSPMCGQAPNPGAWEAHASADTGALLTKVQYRERDRI